nr:unnamed protein product [Digitaria exilis]
MHTPLCSDDVRYTIPAVPMKHACHVTTSDASTAQYDACDRSHLASSSLHPPAAASPATASAVAAACMTTWTSTAMRNPPDTALRYTSSITGRYAAKSPAAPSVTAKPAKYLPFPPPPGRSPESDEPRSARSTELRVRSTTALRLEKVSGVRTITAASTSVKASCVDSSSDEVGRAVGEEEVVDAHEHADHDAGGQQTPREPRERPGLMRGGALAGVDGHEQDGEADGLDQRGHPPVVPAVGEVVAGEKAGRHRAAEEGGVVGAQQKETSPTSRAIGDGGVRGRRRHVEERVGGGDGGGHWREELVVGERRGGEVRSEEGGERGWGGGGVCK